MFKKILSSGIFWTFIAGFIFFWLTIFLTRDEKRPTYAVSKEPSKIVDVDNSFSKLKIVLNDSLVVDRNVYVTNIIIWNSGTKEITKSDVREKIKIEPINGAKILDYKIVNEEKKGISNFKLNPSGNFLVVDWDYFDPNFGFETQITYSGQDESKIIVTGYVIGNEVTFVELNKENTSGHKFFLIVFIIFLAFLSLVAIIGYRKNKINGNTKEEPTLIQAIGFTVFFIVVLGYYLNEFIFKSYPPF